MHVMSSLHFRFKIVGKGFLSLLTGIVLSYLPQSLLAQSAENGKTIYQQKCMACHTIGSGRTVGPDLKGVTSKRDEKWLVRWIKEPNKMLAEGDAIAIQLKQEFGTDMPPMGVSDSEAKDILAYIEVASNAAPEATSTGTTTVQTQTVSLSLSEQSPEKGAPIYQQKCAVCHSIGGEAKEGPDLKGVTSKRDYPWLVRRIVEPNIMLAEGDALSTELHKEYKTIPMPNYGLSSAEAIDVLAYIAIESGEALPVYEAVEEKAPAPTVIVASNSGDSEIGKALFIGTQSFKNGGPACISCHSTSDVGGLGGGTLGPDLTKLYSRFAQHLEILAILPYPTMAAVFDKKPLVETEVAHLTAYFITTDKLEVQESMDFTISLISIGGFLFLYILTHLLWRKRLNGVRIPLVGR